MRRDTQFFHKLLTKKMPQLYTLDLMIKHYALCLIILFVGGQIMTRVFKVKDSKAHWLFYACIQMLIYHTVLFQMFSILFKTLKLLWTYLLKWIPLTILAPLCWELCMHTIQLFTGQFTAADVFHHITFVKFNQVHIFFGQFWLAGNQWEFNGDPTLIRLIFSRVDCLVDSIISF